MVVSMDNLIKIQKKSSIQQNVRKVERIIDRRIELTVLDNNETYKAFSVVVATPNTTVWSGRGPVYLQWMIGLSLEIIDEILGQLADMYRREGYDVLGPERIDIGMNENAPGIHLRIPNKLSKTQGEH